MATKNRQYFAVFCDLEMYRQTRRLAHMENKAISAVIREAIAKHLEDKLGVEVSPGVSRGGWRGGGKG